MTELSVFEAENKPFANDIYLHGLKNEIREIFLRLNKSQWEIAKMLSLNYNAVKEWSLGRRPITLARLSSIIGLCSNDFQQTIKGKIDVADIAISCRKSPIKMKFPKNISPGLAYCIGLILGDGSISSDKTCLTGNWRIGVLFDDLEHKSIYESIIKKELGLNSKYFKKSDKCHVSYVNSKAFHWFVRIYFCVPNGKKCDKIFIPPKILEPKNKDLLTALLSGLFDSDGTITNKKIVKYGSTSKIIVEQVMESLAGLGMDPKMECWLKSEGFLPLYTAELRSKDSIKTFAKVVKFRHKIKQSRLECAVQSPVV